MLNALNGADVNAKGADGIGTPLHLTVFSTRKVRMEIAELLISKGADLNPQRNNGGTPRDLTIIRTALDQLRSTILDKHRPTQTRKEIGELVRKHGCARRVMGRVLITLFTIAVECWKHRSCQKALS